MKRKRKMNVDSGRETGILRILWIMKEKVGVAAVKNVVEGKGERF